MVRVNGTLLFKLFKTTKMFQFLFPLFQYFVGLCLKLCKADFFYYFCTVALRCIVSTMSLNKC